MDSRWQGERRVNRITTTNVQKMKDQNIQLINFDGNLKIINLTTDYQHGKIMQQRCGKINRK